MGNAVIGNAVIVMGLVSLLLGIILTVANRKLQVPVSEEEEKINGVLPGANCGACGYPGCSNYAAAVAKGEAPANKCTVGGSEVAAKIAEIMGLEAEDMGEKQVAVVKCLGKPSVAKPVVQYEGITDCWAAHYINGHESGCEYGCLGLGTCERVCPFDAIKIVDGLPIVDEEKCTGCGICVENCPRNVLELQPVSQKVYIGCVSQNKLRDVSLVCTKGCIACGLCEKKCPYGAITMVGNLPVIDHEKCTNCGVCVAVCPTKTIVDKLPARPKAVIAEDKCKGCTLCAKACPVNAITGEPAKPHKVDPNKCVGCGICVEKCPPQFNAITMIGGLGHTVPEDER